MSKELTKQVFDHWALLGSDPTEIGSKTNELAVKIRTRKGKLTISLHLSPCFALVLGRKLISSGLKPDVPLWDSFYDKL